MSFSDAFGAAPFWHNGPAPGAFYNFPNVKSNHAGGDFAQRSQGPITTGTSIIAIQFAGGVVMAGDILGSYGSLARFRNCPRLMKVNDNIIMGAGGDYGDYQYLKDMIEQKIIDEECMDDGFKLKPKSMYCWLTRVMYNRRSKIDPFWNNLVIGGLEDGEPFLGTVDKLGTAYKDKTICTGYGAYMALPLMRAAVDANPNMNQQEATALVKKCMEVLFYRDARSFPKYQLAVINADGINIEDDLEIEQNWNLANMIH